MKTTIPIYGMKLFLLFVLIEYNNQYDSTVFLSDSTNELATPTNSNSQLLANDATWEETIAFLQKYSGSIKDAQFSKNHRYNINFFPRKKVNISSEGILFGTNGQKRFYNKHDTWNMSSGYNGFYNSYVDLENGLFPFKYLSSAILQNGEKIKLKLSKEIQYNWSRKVDLYNAKKVVNDNGEETTDLFYIVYHRDNELNPRISSAWEHLVELAKDKRKKELQESGDKF